MRTRQAAVARDVAMVVLALVSLVIIYVQETQPLSEQAARRLLYIDLVIVALFWIEFLLRMRGEPSKGAFLGRNWYELPGMIPIFPGMESLGAVRLLRLLRVLRILRLLGALRRFQRFEQAVDRFLHASRLGYIALLGLAVLAASAAVAWAVERETFPTYGDALWWGIVTATTVGYGDYFPRTFGARLAAIPLMLLGVGLIGTFAATLSSFLVERGMAAPREEPSDSFVAAELERLAALRKKGLLDEREFRAAKRRVLSSKNQK